MKTHLKSALESVQIADANLTSAYFAAVKDGDQFAVIVLSDLLESARKLEQRIARALDAAKAKEQSDDKSELLAALRELMTGHSMAGQAMAEKAIARATGEKGGK
jgi:hypothetical protein